MIGYISYYIKRKKKWKTNSQSLMFWMELYINLLVSQHYRLNIWIFPPQDEGQESTWNLNRKAVENDLVKISTSWLWEEIKRIWIHDTIKRLISYPKCRSVEVINNRQDRGRTTGSELYKIINNKWKGVKENFWDVILK